MTALATHPYEQNTEADVRVCRCGKWRDHHVHTGDRDACGCDGCRSMRDLRSRFEEAVQRNPYGTLLPEPQAPTDEEIRAPTLNATRRRSASSCAARSAAIRTGGRRRSAGWSESTAVLGGRDGRLATRETVSMDLVEFLRARLDEDEAAAARTTDEIYLGQVGFFTYYDTNDDPVDHAERHTPARVLREVDAKRELLDEYIREIGDDAANETAQQLGKLLALPYADHPDYREQWRP